MDAPSQHLSSTHLYLPCTSTGLVVILSPVKYIGEGTDKYFHFIDAINISRFIFPHRVFRVCWQSIVRAVIQVQSANKVSDSGDERHSGRF